MSRAGGGGLRAPGRYPDLVGLTKPIRHSRAQARTALTVVGTAVFTVFVGAVGFWLVHQGLG
jgi:hypothetical protein